MFAMSNYKVRCGNRQARHSSPMQALRGSDQRRSEFARRMRAARVHAGLSQRDAAKAIGIKPPTLSLLETDATKSAHVAMAAKVYGVSAAWLQTGEGGMLDGISAMSARAAYVAQQIDLIQDPATRDRCCVLCETFAQLAQAGQLEAALTALQALAPAVPAVAPKDRMQLGHARRSGGDPEAPT
jgi:transcriptional regulator with XRE-family HTH domain